MTGSKSILESRIPEIVAELPAKLDAVAEAGAELISATAQEKVQVSPGDGPHLRDRIHTEKVKTGTHAVIAGDGETWYGMLLEHGTSHSAPHPFLVPALEEDKPEVVALAEAAVRTLA
jgi:HK97 gp10 family phage protein